MQCPVCGAQISDDAKVCPDCGTEIEAQPEEAPAASEPAPVASQAPAEAPAAPSPPQPAVGARLLVKRGGRLTGEEFPLGDRVVVGRFDVETGPVDLDLSTLPEAPYLSRRHAEIYQDTSGQWFVKDLGSSNGTYLWTSGSGQPQKLPPDQPTTINDGDEIAFGNARFVFRTQ